MRNNWTIVLAKPSNQPMTRAFDDLVLQSHDSSLFMGSPSYSRCIMSEDKVASFDRLVAGKAGFEQRRVRRFAVFELSKPPATGRGIFFRVFDHKLNVRGGSGHERLRTPKDFVVFLGRDITPGEACDGGAVRERQLSLAVCLDRYIVAEKGAKIVEIAFFVGHRNQLPVAVSGRNCDCGNRISLSIGASGGMSHIDDHANYRCNCN